MDVAFWESFGKGWYSDTKSHLKLKCNAFKADYGECWDCLHLPLALPPLISHVLPVPIPYSRFLAHRFRLGENEELFLLPLTCLLD